MSRIVGLCGPSGNASEVSGLLDRMLEGAAGAATWSRQGIARDSAALGWTGPGTTQIHQEGEVVAALDGSIFNTEELGGGPGAAVLARLYQQHGFEGALQRINGDFGAALCDLRTGTLYAGRDRFGIKPLYYWHANGRFALASQPRALLALPGVSREVNRQFVALFAGSHYRTFDNAPEQSPYAALHQLPAGHFLEAKGGAVRQGCYWRLEEQPDFTGSEEELERGYRELLVDAVRLRLGQVRRPGFTLSGGMDSSSVLACAVHVSGRKQHAFSSVYEDPTYDETDEIRSMLDATVEEWHPIAVGNPDVFGLIREMIAVHDEPIATATWLSHFLVCRAAAQQGFDSLFGGLGGDELNAGEYEHFFYFFADLRRAGLEQRFLREVEMWAHYHNHPVFHKDLAVAEEALTRVVDLSVPGRCLPDRRRIDRYSDALNPDYFDLHAYEPVMDHPFTSYLKNRTYQDMMRETIPCCLRAEDRQTTAFGLGHFLPFFDHRLVEYMYRVPTPLKYREGVTKHVLREAMTGILPEETRTRVKKTGWNAPAHVWFSGPRREPLLDLLHSRAFQERGIYHIPEVLRLADEHEEIVTSGRVADHHMMFFWQLVNLELWLQSLEG